MSTLEVACSFAVFLHWLVPLGQNVSLGHMVQTDTVLQTQAHLWPQCWDVEEVHVAQVGEAHQRVLAVVLLRRGAEDHQRHLPHPAALVRRQLELGFGAHLRQREHLCTTGERAHVTLIAPGRATRGRMRPPSAAPPRR